MDLPNDYFTITPMSQRISLEPGQTYTGKITIVNPASATGDFNYQAYVKPYSVVDEDYKADLATMSNRTMMADWIIINEPKGTLKPNEIRDIEFTVNVPDDAPAGGQYAAIAVSRDPGGDTNDDNLAVQNIFEIASIIYGDVNGEIIRSGEILENNIPGFVTNAPITVSALLNNSGNIHENATIIIEVVNKISGEEILEAENQNNYYSELIMPETTRFIQRDIIDNLPTIGVVHVEQTINYNGHYSKEAKDVIICPVWFIILIATILILIIELIVAAILKYRKKRKQSKHPSPSSKV